MLGRVAEATHADDEGRQEKAEHASEEGVRFVLIPEPVAPDAAASG